MLNMVIILQYVVHHYAVYLKYTALCVNYISIKLKKGLSLKTFGSSFLPKWEMFQSQVLLLSVHIKGTCDFLLSLGLFTFFYLRTQRHIQLVAELSGCQKSESSGSIYAPSFPSSVSILHFLDLLNKLKLSRLTPLESFLV